MENNPRSYCYHHHHHQQQQILRVDNTIKSKRKSTPPLHHTSAPQRPPPQIYNITKSDFRSVVQRLTGYAGTGRGAPPAKRLQLYRPPPLADVPRPPVTVESYYSNDIPVHAAPTEVDAATPGAGTSPLTAYMRYLESSLFSVREQQPRGVSQGYSQLLTPSFAKSPPLLPPSPGMFLSSFLSPSPSALLNLTSPSWREHL